MIKRNKGWTKNQLQCIGQWKKPYNKNLNKRYSGMLQRCYNPTCKLYTSYGKRGIEVCKTWKESLFAFRKWAYENGYQPGYHIHRIDPKGNYSPDNCVWLSPFQHRKIHHPNMLNGEQIFSVLLMYDKKEIKQKEIASVYNVHVNTIHRICSGKGRKKYYKFYHDNVDDILNELTTKGV